MWTEITRRKYDRAVQRYASNLSDAEWALIEPFMTVRKLLGPPAGTGLRRCWTRSCMSRGVAANGGCCQKTLRPSQCKGISMNDAIPASSSG